jgi:hypothetical protein
MQGNARKKACISLVSFGRNGPFQRVTWKKIKKSPPRLKNRPGCKKRRTAPILTLVGTIAGLSTIEIVIARIIAPILALRKKRSANSRIPLGRESPFRCSL